MADRASGRAEPWAMSWRARRHILLCSWKEAGDDNIALAAAGVAFYAFLALVPLLGAIVLSYGLVAEPSTVVRHMHRLTSVMPADAAKLIGLQLMNVVETSGGKKGLGLLLALAIALFGARNGAGAIITALNIAYEQKECRGTVKLTVIALAMTAGAVVIAVVAMIAIAALGHLQALLPALADWAGVAGKVLSYLLFTCAVAAAAATLYRFAPSRPDARFIWITPGSLFTALAWLVLTLGFGTYVAELGHYEATYGSLGTVMVLLTWLYLSSYALLFGAELNSEFEHQAGNQDASEKSETPSLFDERPVCPSGEPATAAQAPPAGDSSPPSGDRREAAALFGGARVVASAGHLAGFGKVGFASSALAAFGLARIRHGRSVVPGIALLAGAGALAWWRRAEPKRLSVRAVLFDLDGTLVDSNGYHVEAWRDAFARSGHAVPAGAIHDQIGKGGDLLIPALLPGLRKSERKTVSDAHDEVFRERFLGAVKPFPQARALLEAVHQRGRKIVLASSASRQEVDHYIRLLDAAALVDAAITIDDVSASKPEPDIFESALSKVGVAPDEAIVVGDTPYDVEAAAKCGVATIAVRSGGFSDEQLAGAAALYDDAAALLAHWGGSPLARGSREPAQPPRLPKMGRDFKTALRPPSKPTS